MGIAYVVKFRNNPQHRRILINELLSSVLLDYLRNLRSRDSAPPRRLVEFLAGHPDVHLTLGTRRIEVEPGWQFGSRYPGDPARTAVYDFLPDALLPVRRQPRGFPWHPRLRQVGRQCRRTPEHLLPRQRAGRRAARPARRSSPA